MVKLECLNEVRLDTSTPGKTILYEDGFGYTYDVDEETATTLLAMTDLAGAGCFKIQ